MENYEEISEAVWLHAATANQIFAFLTDPAEDIYTLADGKAFTDEESDILEQ